VSEKDLRIELDRADVRIGEVVKEINAARDLAKMAVGHPNRPDNSDLRIHLDLAERRIAQALEALAAARDEVVAREQFEGGLKFKKKNSQPRRLRDVKSDKTRA
jgi:hypothetical protein